MPWSFCERLPCCQFFDAPTLGTLNLNFLLHSQDRQSPVDQEENYVIWLFSRGHFPLFALLDLRMAKASVCCSTIAVSFQAETKPALLSFAGNEGASYMANLHAPM